MAPSTINSMSKATTILLSPKTISNSINFSSIPPLNRISQRQFHFNEPPSNYLNPRFRSSSLQSGIASRNFHRPVVATAAVAVSGEIIRDAGVTAMVMAGGYGLVSAFNILTTRDVISQNLSRKLVHILSGLIFMASWPLFSSSPEARYFASVVPLTNCFRLMIQGISPSPDKGLLKSLTREGKPEELLRGPFYYVLVLALCAVFFWRESLVGVMGLAMMCGGDGIADIVGRRFGHVKIPYNQKKSWAGSISMFVAGFLISLGMLYYFSALGYFQLDWFRTAQRVALVSFTATAIESLPITHIIDDNISVPIAAMVTAYMCFCM